MFKMNAQKFSFSFFIVFLFGELALFGLFILFYLYDPFQFFHAPIWREKTFMSDMRVSAAGIIDNMSFDSIITGSSMLENTSIHQAQEKIGGKWVNLSFGVARFKERNILLNYAFKRQNIQNVIYSLDSYDFMNVAPATMIMNEKIYSENKITRFVSRFPYYFNTHFLRCVLYWKNDSGCVGYADLENLTKWYFSRKRGFQGFDYWWEDRKEGSLKGLHIVTKNLPPPPAQDIVKIKQYVQNYLFDLIQQNPNVQFHLIVPPFARAFYKIPTEKIYHEGRTGAQYYADFKTMLLWILKELEPFKNVKIYAFDDLDYPNHLNNYCDGNHYNTDMNSLFLTAVQSNTHRLTLNNQQQFFEKMENEINNYDIQPFILSIKKYEQSKKNQK